MKFIATLMLFALSTGAFAQDHTAANLDRFFSKIEGSWKMINSRTEVRRPDGQTVVGKNSQYEIKVSTATKSWSVYEESCEIEASEEDESCGETWAVYTLEGSRFYVSIAGNDPQVVTTLGITPSQMSFSLTLDGATITSKRSLTAAGQLVQQSITRTADGTIITNTVMLKRK